MKKVLIMATAMIFAVSSTMLAANQSPAGKKQEPQKTTTQAKSEVQKQAVKAESKTNAAEMKTSVATNQQTSPRTMEKPVTKKGEKNNKKTNSGAIAHKGMKHHKSDKVPHSTK